jgi:hypothetical protein
MPWMSQLERRGNRSAAAPNDGDFYRPLNSHCAFLISGRLKVAARPT